MSALTLDDLLGAASDPAPDLADDARPAALAWDDEAIWEAVRQEYSETAARRVRDVVMRVLGTVLFLLAAACAFYAAWELPL